MSHARRVAHLTSIALVATALAAPAAHADPPAGNLVTPAGPVSPDNRADRPAPNSLLMRAGATQARPASTPGFDWGDAGIGAAAMLGLGVAGAGITIAARKPSARLPI